MMAHLRLFGCLLGSAFLLCRVSFSESTGSTSLIVPRGAPARSQQFQQNQAPRAGLLEQHGKCQVVHIDEGVEKLPIHPGKERPVKHVKASLLTFGLFAVLFRNMFVLSPTRNDWAGLVVLLILYLVEAATCSTRRYLSNICTPSQVKDMVEQMREVSPRVRWNVECYHYEDDHCLSPSSHRAHHDNSSKRVTHRATEVYHFRQWRDVSWIDGMLESLQFGSTAKASYLKITLLKLLLFLDITSYQDYLAQQARFIARHRHFDRYMDSWTTIEVNGYKPKILAVRTVLGSQGHVRTWVYWTCTLLGLTVPYRYFFARNCDEVDLVISKQVAV